MLSDTKPAIQPKLRRDVVFFETAEGIYFRSGQKKFTLKGNGIYQSFVKLLPYLDGSERYSNLLETLSEAQRSRVSALVDSLIERNIIDVVDYEDSQLSIEPDVLSHFSSHLEYIAHVADRPRERFLRFRESRILLVGDGPVLQQAARALVRNGLRQVFLNSNDREVPDAVDAEARALGIGGSHAGRVFIQIENPLSLSNYDLVLAAPNANSLAVLYDLNRQAIRDAGQLLPACTLANDGLIGPFVQTGTSPCWFCSILRWVTNAELIDGEMIWRQILTGGSGFLQNSVLSRPAAAIVGNNLAFEAFRFTSGLSPEARSAVLLQDLRTLEARRVLLQPHPHCPFCKDSPWQTDAERAGDDSSREAVLERWTERMDPAVGILKKFNDADLIQVPVRQSAIEMNVSYPGSRPMKVLACSDETSEDARIAALRTALKTYATVIVSGMHLAVSENPLLREIPLSQVWGAAEPSSFSPAQSGFITATRVDSQEQVRIRATALLPAVPPSPEELAAVPGFGIGFSEEEAISDGLLCLAEAFARQTAISRPSALHILPAARIYECADCARRMFLLHHSGFEPRLYHTNVFSGVVVVLATLSRDPEPALEHFTIAAGFSLGEALGKATLELLGVQARPSDTTYLIPGPYLGAYRNAPVRVSGAAETPFNFREAALTVAEVAQIMAPQHHSFYFADLTPKDLKALKTFQFVKVLLARANPTE